MASTREALEESNDNLLESIGRRSDSTARRKLSPIPKARDIGRRPAKGFGSVLIDQVMPDPNQPRSEFSQEAVSRLAQSIQDNGQLHPIRVRWDVKLDKWVIVSGERRWRATQEAGIERITCYFHNDSLSEAETLEQQLVENLLREDLRPIEEAKAFSELMRLNRWNGKQVARALHLSESKVSRSLGLLDLPDDLQNRVDTGEIAARSAYEISKLDNRATQRDLGDQAAAGKLTAGSTSKSVRKLRGKKALKSRSTSQTFFADGGWKIVVSAKHKGSYPEMEEALVQVLDEVRHYIANGRVLL